MHSVAYSKYLKRAVSFREEGIWVMARNTVSPKTAQLLDAVLDQALE